MANDNKQTVLLRRRSDRNTLEKDSSFDRFLLENCENVSLPVESLPRKAVTLVRKSELLGVILKSRHLGSRWNAAHVCAVTYFHLGGR